MKKSKVFIESSKIVVLGSGPESALRGGQSGKVREQLAARRALPLRGRLCSVQGTALEQRVDTRESLQVKQAG